MVYTNPTDFMSALIVNSKYAKLIPELHRKENWEEVLLRSANMEATKYPHISDEIYAVYGRSILPRHVLPSMRKLQFAGKAIEKNPSRLYNCASIAMDSTAAFSELMFLLLGGSGVGISVQKHHVAKLNTVTSPRSSHRRFFVQDSIMGWADSIKALMHSYFEDREYIDFDFSEIRKQGEILKTAGGTAPGPEPLIEAINNIRRVIDYAIETRGEGTRLTTLDVHDIACFISEAVLAGGIRRSAMISLFSHDDDLMMYAKTEFDVSAKRIEKTGHDEYTLTVVYKGLDKEIVIDNDKFLEFTKTKKLTWRYFEPQRSRANNSVILLRSATSPEYFADLMIRIKKSRCGEPGVYWTNDLEMLCNPCVEISIPCGGFCNLTIVNTMGIKSVEDLHQRIRDAVFMGTIQAGFTDFHYLRPMWRENAERDALLGVGLAGIASGSLFDYDIKEAAKVALAENERVSKLIGINLAKRIGCVKPDGTSSLVLGTSSGIHPWWNDYYIRNIEIAKDKPLYKYALEKLGPEIVKDDVYKPTVGAIISVPMKAPEGAKTRHESPFDLLERVKKIQIEWIRGTHREGVNCHTVSVTVPVKEEDWKDIGVWMWDNREIYNGISLMDFDGGSYPQMPHEDITEAEYIRLEAILHERAANFNIEEVVENEEANHSRDTVACAGGGACELVQI